MDKDIKILFVDDRLSAINDLNEALIDTRYEIVNQIAYPDESDVVYNTFENQKTIILNDIKKFNYDLLLIDFLLRTGEEELAADRYLSVEIIKTVEADLGSRNIKFCFVSSLRKSPEQLFYSLEEVKPEWNFMLKPLPRGNDSRYNGNCPYLKTKTYCGQSFDNCSFTECFIKRLNKWGN